jgi:hypothetical protein
MLIVNKRAVVAAVLINAAMLASMVATSGKAPNAPVLAALASQEAAECEADDEMTEVLAMAPVEEPSSSD